MVVVEGESRRSTREYKHKALIYHIFYSPSRQILSEEHRGVLMEGENTNTKPIHRIVYSPPPQILSKRSVVAERGPLTCLLSSHAIFPYCLAFFSDSSSFRCRALFANGDDGGQFAASRFRGQTHLITQATAMLCRIITSLFDLVLFSLHPSSSVLVRSSRRKEGRGEGEEKKTHPSASRTPLRASP